jgi:hypothetical protein
MRWQSRAEDFTATPHTVHYHYIFRKELIQKFRGTVWETLDCPTHGTLNTWIRWQLSPDQGNVRLLTEPEIHSYLKIPSEDTSAT